VNTRETVETDTPAACATSRMVGRLAIVFQAPRRLGQGMRRQRFRLWTAVGKATGHGRAAAGSAGSSSDG
jgi:hypothetical protein